MKRRFQQFSILSLIVLFLFSLAPEEVESRRGGRSFSRSSSRRSYSAPRRSYSKTRSSRSTYTRPRTTSSTSRRSNYSRTTPRSTSTRASTAARQKQTATNRARNTTATQRTTSATRSQQRKSTAQNRKQVRQLKAENRSLKRQVRRADRRTARARRDARATINVGNFGMYYPVTAYSMYGLTASMAFNNILYGIYFHDYYNHAIRHSYLWHYHHPSYDRSHWDAKKQAEYEYYKEYYESQGIEPNSNYVDPGTNRDEDYAASYVEENPDKFYGENAVAFTVEELPDEEALKQELLASAESSSVTATASRAPPVPEKIVIENRTSGGTWFLLIFGSFIIVGAIVLVMYNKGYF